jgi:ATPase family associated with various cellular activities (AAA)
VAVRPATATRSDPRKPASAGPKASGTQKGKAKKKADPTVTTRELCVIVAEDSPASRRSHPRGPTHEHASRWLLCTSVQVGMPSEALQAELAAAGILKRCPAVELQQCVAGGILVSADPQQPPPWLAVRSALLATCVLPLASPALHARYDSAWATRYYSAYLGTLLLHLLCWPSVTAKGHACTAESLRLILYRTPAPRAMLLIGAPGSGKTMVAQAIAHSVGAALFDLSPRTTDGKWPGKAAATMVCSRPLIYCIITHCGISLLTFQSPFKLNLTCLLLPTGQHGGQVRQAAAAVNHLH